jgi:hypothetical protein
MSLKAERPLINVRSANTRQPTLRSWLRTIKKQRIRWGGSPIRMINESKRREDQRVRRSSLRLRELTGQGSQIGVPEFVNVILDVFKHIQMFLFFFEKFLKDLFGDLVFLGRTG